MICPRCHADFIPGNHRAKYCKPCAAAVEQEHAAERSRRHHAATYQPHRPKCKVCGSDLPPGRRAYCGPGCFAESRADEREKYDEPSPIDKFNAEFFGQCSVSLVHDPSGDFTKGALFNVEAIVMSGSNLFHNGRGSMVRMAVWSPGTRFLVKAKGRLPKLVEVGKDYRIHEVQE